jgi:hypothetical protein
MDTYTTISIYILVGVVVAVVITGGLVSMVSHDEPSLVQLASGGAIGAAVGGSLSSLGSLGSLTKMTDMFQTGGAQEMRTGLPAF